MSWDKIPAKRTSLNMFLEKFLRFYYHLPNINAKIGYMIRITENYKRGVRVSKQELKQVETIVVLDYGSQYNQLITRRIRELGVYSELLSHRVTAAELKERNIVGIILSGGPMSVSDEGAFDIDPEILELDVPILGICYGMQLMVRNLGGKVEPSKLREYGKSEIEIRQQSGIFQGLSDNETVWMSHGDKVTELPSGFDATATNPHCPIAAMAHQAKQLYGVQFHPEVQHTDHGTDMLRQFALDICGASANWDMGKFIDIQVEKIRELVGDKQVLLGLSGGVDSSVTGVLLHKAIGDQLTCIFVDHGLLRKNEGDEVMSSLEGKFGLNIIRVNAQEQFLDKLKGVSDPEEKRKIIGHEFIEVFKAEADKLDGIEFLAQGTLYTDIIESGTETAETIKSHHNVGGLPEDLQFDLIEPMNTLFKDEVRALGEELGMPSELVWRQPFPGPGLGIRVLGEVTREKLEVVRNSDAILREEIRKAGLDRDVWQYFTVLPGFKSVGVMGDGRTYDYTIGIRGVTSVDGMTADWARIPYEVLEVISRRIVNECENINRVVYDITSKPPATIEWE